MPIKVLDSHLISQIAAGEVIERPSSVVKELLENSLDSGATEINLEIQNGGTKLIRIRDNGSGIAKEELSLALSRHATSKITNLDDLEQVKSLGFRGEALASISAVARCKLTSRTQDSQVAWELITDGAFTQQTPKPSAHPVGTTVEVSDLFFNIPVRRKFLRTVQTEFNHILEIVGRLALSRFDVGFTLKHNGKLIWTLGQAVIPQERLQRVGEIVGKEFISVAYVIEVGGSDLKLSGWIAEPNYTRSQPDIQYLYINGRVVRDKSLSHAIRQAYQDVIFQQRHPVVVLYLDIDPILVDVNVHPTKAEVRFSDSRLLHDFVFHSLKESLANLRNSQNIANKPLSTSKTTAPVTLESSQTSFTQHFKQPDIPFVTFTKQKFEKYREFSPIVPPRQMSEEACVSNIKLLPLGFALAQLHGTYILAQNEEGLIIVDIHAAHERINYEKLKTQYHTTTIPHQTLLIPLAIVLNQKEINCVETNVELLEKFGFILTCNAENSVLVRATPVLLQDADIEQLLKDLIADLMVYGTPDSIVENSNEILANMACHRSVRAHHKLGLDTMNDLLRTIEKTANGGQCGHGRPSWLPFSLKHLAGLFLRG